MVVSLLWAAAVYKAGETQQVLDFQRDAAGA